VFLARQIQQQQSGGVGPSTNTQSEGARNSLHEPQFFPLEEAVLNLTEALESLTVALAWLAISAEAALATAPPTSNILRES
jgi:hypothetical protein